ncbi:stage III sporulation protein SpoIIIAB [Haloimpatiens sp. FM7330]|uniref:stage III sporulation protein SpoIIIAB n=1 Tax=Haloimpatiens sp. FM7330 TaxID=3298610 RepID=UPI00363D6974
MIKIIGCVIIIFSSTFIGILYGRVCRKRVEELKDLERNIYELKNQMLYTYTSLPEAFYFVFQKSKTFIGKIFLSVSNLLYEGNVKNVYEAFKISIKSQKNKLSINEDDINIMLNLAKSLGESDLSGQQAILNLALENIKKQEEEAEYIMKKNVKMYRYLGFTVGCVLAIMLI